MSVRSNLVKMGKLVDMTRPGIAQSFMVPTKMENQVRGTPLTDLRYTPRVTPEGTQWRIAVQRPGLAEPLITAKAEQLTAEQVVKATNAKETPASASAIRAEVAVANASNKPGPGIAGFFAGLFGSW